jgi:putative addiction module CopG family antidote
MPSTHAINVSLTEELCTFVADQVASGPFRTASEVVRAALRLLERQHEPAREARRSGDGKRRRRAAARPNPKSP